MIIKENIHDYKKVVFSFKNQRIGDCVGAEGIISKFRLEYPAIKIYLISDIKNNLIPLKWIYGNIVNEIIDVSDDKKYSEIRDDRSILKLGFLKGYVPIFLEWSDCLKCNGNTWGGHKCYGSTWVAGNYFAKYHYYPKFKLPKNILFNKIDFKNNELAKYIKIVVHILEDASYNKIRNHDISDFISLCQKLIDNHTNVLIIRIGLNMNDKLPNYKDRVIDLTDLNISVGESAYIISLADIYIGGDTGMTHLAGALDVKNIIAIYGNNRNTNLCSKIQGPEEKWSSFPIVEPERLTKIIMQNNRFNPDHAYRLIKERLSTMIS